MADGPVIHVEGQRIVPRAIMARMEIQTEDWVARKPTLLARLSGSVSNGKWVYGPDYARAVLEIEIEVDDESGADGALWPRLCIRFDPGAWRGTDFAALAGRSFAVGEAGVAISGFYGNDAPDMQGNCVRFEAGCEAGELLLDWTAQFRWRPRDPLEAFHFSGPIRIEGLWLALKRDEDLAPILAACLPGFDTGSLEQPEVTDQHYSAVEQADRQHWRHWSFASRST